MIKKLLLLSFIIALKFNAFSYEDKIIDPKHKAMHLTTMPGAKIQYQQCYSYYTRQELKNAVTACKNFLKLYPDDFLSINTLSVLANIYYGINRSDLAIEQIKYIVNNYDWHDREQASTISAAIYLLGQIFEDQKDVAASKYYFGKIIAEFPETSSAKDAQKKLGLK